MAMKLEMVVLRAPRAMRESALEATVATESAARGAGPGEDAELVSAARRRSRGGGLADVEVQLDEMTAEGLRRATADSSVLCAAPRMPVTLIKSWPSHNGRAAAAWQIVPVAPDNAALASAHAAATASRVSWGVDAVKATNSAFTGEGITVAVLDTGIKATLDAGGGVHPAFKDVELVTRNFTDDTPEDVDGHGTHCAGTIFGRDVDNRRIGIARGVNRALIGKVLGNTGGSSEQIVRAIQWAQIEGADIVSMSLGMDFPGYQKMLVEKYDMPLERATSLALAGYRLNTRLFDQLSRTMVGHEGLMSGCVVTAAAGNESSRPDYTIIVAPPATGELFISVAALGPAGAGKYRVADFSNEGATISAPGEDIWSARMGGGLVAFSGTSMATPHVAGVAALWGQKLKQENNFSAKNVVERIKATALALPLDQDDIGCGLVQAP